MGLAPHLGIKHPKAIEVDYGMHDGYFAHQGARVCLAGYVLRR